jgi:hypothetical protein
MSAEDWHNIEMDHASSHAAISATCCEEMSRKYGWQLVRVDATGDRILPVRCIFRGRTEFPCPKGDTEKSNNA